MRFVIFVIAAVQFAAVSTAAAQAVIDIEREKAASPQVPDQGQPQTQQRETTQIPTPGRYTFNRVDNNFVRLDNESGQVAYCSPRAEGWTCQAVADRPALETEIASLQRQVALLKKLDTDVGQLKDEISSLKKEIAGLKKTATSRPPAESPQSRSPDVSVRLPTHEDIIRARDYLEETWRRLVEIMVGVQKDIMRRS